MIKHEDKDVVDKLVLFAELVSNIAKLTDALALVSDSVCDLRASLNRIAETSL